MSFLDRPPRIQPELPLGEVEVPQPPQESESSQPLWQAFVPIVAIMGYVLVSATGQGSNVAFLIPMAVTVFLSTGIALYNGIRAWSVRREARQNYKRRLLELRREMTLLHSRQKSFYEYNYPDPEVVTSIDGTRQDTRSGSRLWERRSRDDDFGYVRLGIGTRPSTIQYKLASSEDNNASPLRQEAERLVTDARYVVDAPITIPLYRQPSEDAEDEAGLARTIHTLGIAGDPQEVQMFANSLVAHFAAFHSPQDTAVLVVGIHEAVQRWEWVYALPHCTIDRQRGQTRVYFEDVEKIGAPVAGTIKEILVRSGDVAAPQQELVRIQTADGHMVGVKCSHLGRVEIHESVRVGNKVAAGDLLMRTNAFEMSKQQLNEELTRPDLYRRRGKEVKRELAGIPRFWKEKIWAELDRRSRRLRDKEEGQVLDVTLPFMLIVVDLISTTHPSDAMAYEELLKKSWLYDLESEAAIALLNAQGQALGAAIIYLVPNRSKVPSNCQAVIELKRDPGGQLKFLYAETGLNTTRYVGDADVIRKTDLLKAYAEKIAHWEVRRSFGADIPRTVGLLTLYDANTIEQLRLIELWQESQKPDRADWPKVPLGMLAGREPRELHFFADADGVHGMIAGSTGSGKSELLMTMIMSLAIKYDPSVVNFLLVDYKGGAAFEPFEGLPHVVDTVTNLGPNAVARMFASINAELNRRQAINQDTDSKDIVRYRKNGNGLKRRDNYPHLFIIIDEFAEMIANNAEFKAQLDSITRLGRALGVSLILAAQRPTGVTDQMRANIKFRICLRVETKEESSELLRLPDAAYLPSIPGRGYLQVGSESLENIQVAYTGMPYNNAPDYNPLERFFDSLVIFEDDLAKEEDDFLYDVLVRRMTHLTNQKYPNRAERPWWKPWPNPLPPALYLDSPTGIELEYLRSDDREYIEEMLNGQPFCFVPAITAWLNGQTHWAELEWPRRAMRVPVGLVDAPSEAKLHLLMADFPRGHYAIFGGAGWGKSTALRSIITALVCTHSPRDLHLYLLDFGNRSLQVFEGMPHTGAFILSHEEDRIKRFMRWLDQEIEERKEILAESASGSFYDYNDTHGDAILPALLIAVDNFAEFKETYGDYVDAMASLLRDGLSVGVHFVLTADQSSALGKLFNLVPERVTLRLADDGEYSNIVGRGGRPVDEIPGRGLRRIGRMPLEVQFALPISRTEDEIEEGKDEKVKLEALLEKLKQSWVWANDHERPMLIERLSDRVTLQDVLPNATFDTVHRVVVGINDYDLKPIYAELESKPHFIVSGPPSSGKTTALYTWILSLAHAYSPQEVAMVLVDYQETLAEYGGEHRLDDLPHVLGPVISQAEQFADLLQHLAYEYPVSGPLAQRHLHIIIDNYDDFDELLAKNDYTTKKLLADLARRAGKRGLHFVICGSRNALSNDDLVRPVASNRTGLAMDVETAGQAPFYANIPSSYGKMELNRGRGFMLRPGGFSLVQVATPIPEEIRRAESLDEQVKAILAKDYARATWIEQVGSTADATPVDQPDEPLPAGIAVEDEDSGGLSADGIRELRHTLAEQMGMELDALEPISDAGIIEMAKRYGVLNDETPE